MLWLCQCKAFDTVNLPECWESGVLVVRGEWTDGCCVSGGISSDVLHSINAHVRLENKKFYALYTSVYLSNSLVSFSAWELHRAADSRPELQQLVFLIN